MRKQIKTKKPRTEYRKSVTYKCKPCDGTGMQHPSQWSTANVPRYCKQCGGEGTITQTYNR